MKADMEYESGDLGSLPGFAITWILWARLPISEGSDYWSCIIFPVYPIIDS